MLAKRFFIGLAILLAACARESSTTRDHAADSTAVAAAMDGYVSALRSSDAAAISGFWSEDAVYIAPGAATIRGHAAFDAHVRDTFGKIRITEITAGVDETIVDGDLAFQTGTYSETLQPTQGGAAQKISGRFLFVWRKQPDGTWRIARGISTDLPAT